MTRINYSILLLLIFPFSMMAQDWKTFSDPEIDFTAKYPATWVNKIKEGKRVFFTSPPENDSDQFSENLNISMKKNAAFGTQIKIKEAIPSILNELGNNIDNFKLESEKDFKWNGNEAYELVYTGSPKESELTIKITQWLCFSKGRLFTATYTAMVNNVVYVAPAKKIMESIRFR
jgi:PsbP-like protein